MAGHGKDWKKLGDGSLPAEDQVQGLGHIVSIKVYKNVFYALLMLTFITVWAATKDFGFLNVTVALSIASVKAALVGVFFMHLKFESKTLWIIALYPFFILVLLFIGTLGDASIKEKPTPLQSSINSTN